MEIDTPISLAQFYERARLFLLSFFDPRSPALQPLSGSRLKKTGRGLVSATDSVRRAPRAPSVTGPSDHTAALNPGQRPKPLYAPNPRRHCPARPTWGLGVDERRGAARFTS